MERCVYICLNDERNTDCEYSIFRLSLVTYPVVENKMEKYKNVLLF